MRMRRRVSSAACSASIRSDLLPRLSAPRRFVWLKRHLRRPSGGAIVRLGLPGIGFRTEWHRVYPQRELTAHLVGYVGVENQGLAGIELSFEDRLTGPGAAKGPLALTIDLGVQEAVRSELAQRRRALSAPKPEPDWCSMRAPA